MTTSIAPERWTRRLRGSILVPSTFSRGGAMRAWTVDADDIRVAGDLDESLLHKTPEIDAFLTPDRDDKFIVIGTKGFGKTLLLKAKRILYQRDSRAACLPTGALLDKPIGDKIFGREALAIFATSPSPWSKVWLTATAVAVPKHAGATAQLDVSPRLPGLARDEQLHGVIAPFVRLLDLAPSELLRCAADTDGHLVPRLRALNTPMAIFIDGIDEYFNKHVEEVAKGSSVTGELSPNVWYFAQLGLVEVAYQLRRAGPRRGGVPAAANHPSPQGLRRRAEGALRPPAPAHRDVPAVSRQRRRHRVLARELAGDLREQHPFAPCRSHGDPRATARRPAGGLPGTDSGDAPVHPRARGRLCLCAAPHPAAAARSHDGRRAAGRASSGRAEGRAPLQASGDPGGDGDRARVSRGDRAPRRASGSGRAAAAAPGGHLDSRRSGR